MGIVIEEARTLERFLALEADWRRLVDCAEESTIFQTWEWNANRWAMYCSERRDGRRFQLAALAAYDGDMVVGIAPLCFERIPGIPVRRLVFFGGDYCTFISATGYQPAVTTAFVERIRRLIGMWDVVELKGLHEAFQATRLMRDMNLATEISAGPYLVLPGSVVELNNAFGNRIRRILEYRRSLQRRHNARMIVADRTSLDHELEEFFRLHRQRWQMKNKPGMLGEPERLFHRRVAAEFLPKGYLQLFSLKVGEKTIASVCCYLYRGVMTYYLGGFDPAWEKARPGWILLYESIIRSIELGCQRYDFGDGDEGYKMSWHPQMSRIFGWRYARKNVVSQALLRGYSGIYRVVSAKNKS